MAIAPKDSKLNLMESSIRRYKNGVTTKIILITDDEEANNRVSGCTYPNKLPTSSSFSFVNAIPIQLLAYHVGVMNGVNVDRPRNLAKSVTVVDSIRFA